MAKTRTTCTDRSRILTRQPRPRAEVEELSDAEGVDAAAAQQRSLQEPYVAAAASAAAPVVALAGFEALPPEVLPRIFAAVPVTERAALACVARSWAAYLARPEPWRVLDLSPGGGVPRTALSAGFLDPKYLLKHLFVMLDQWFGM